VTRKRLDQLLNIAHSEDYALKSCIDPYEIDRAGIDWFFINEVSQKKLFIQVIFIQTKNYSGYDISLSDAAYLNIKELDESIDFSREKTKEWIESLRKFKKLLNDYKWAN
jgi:hypothetical protein